MFIAIRTFGHIHMMLDINLCECVCLSVDIENILFRQICYQIFEIFYNPPKTTRIYTSIPKDVCDTDDNTKCDSMARDDDSWCLANVWIVFHAGRPIQWFQWCS